MVPATAPISLLVAMLTVWKGKGRLFSRNQLIFHEYKNNSESGIYENRILPKVLQENLRTLHVNMESCMMCHTLIT